jgi:protocatechuate 3,4-dioxygenase beta subunit
VLRFAGRTSLRGKVLDGAGQPRPRFKVWVLDATGRLVGGNLYTDDNGEFGLAGVPAGELTVIPIAPGPFPGRDALLDRGTKIEVSAERVSEPLVLVVP